ncbi:Proteasome subunit beta type-4 [Perkinsus olseni]|uniref:Proteasome subunit beta type-4 n=1 Tax=Perkinsus olseni TaxID=32597 RepID=A0A7J6MH91_PEROL|nr:Proteasome subunit beta type-4 [Perkinsus olseni]
MRRKHRNNMTEAEAREMLEECMEVLFHRHCYCSNRVKFVTVTAEGSRISDEVVLSGTWIASSGMTTNKSLWPEVDEVDINLEKPGGYRVLIGASRVAPAGLPQRESKAAWYGLTLADQDALAETALQYVSHEVNNELPQESSISVMNPIRYASQCLDTVILYKTGLYSEADQVVCFQKHLTILAGQWDARTTRSNRFVDPREIDINYRVTLTSRINGTPMVVHWAGSATKFEDMSSYVHRLARVNISTITKSGWPRVCREELWSSQSRTTCTPGSTEDLWCDSYLCG